MQSHTVSAASAGADSRSVLDRESHNDVIPAALRDHPRYRIVKRLGRGGMGVVYKAEHRLMVRSVAFKVISRQWISIPLAVERFQREVKLAARLTHLRDPLVSLHSALLAIQGVFDDGPGSISTALLCRRGCRGDNDQGRYRG